jgi:soluble lytic murein transglycosylase-like protein
MCSWRYRPLQTMRRVSPVALRTSFFLALGIIVPTSSQAADGIATVRENGRTVYVNAESPTERALVRSATQASSPYQYWSNTERRWVRVSRPSRAALKAARSAVAEVESYVSSHPQGTDLSAEENPGYRTLANGRQVSAAEIDKAIDEAATKHNVDPNLVRALIKVESNFNASAVSRKGAMGLMQLMPQTAKNLRVSNPFDPQQNVDAGVRHLKELLNSYNGDVPLTLAAYNAGQGAVARNNGIPPYRETKNYVKRITQLYFNGTEPGSRVFAAKAAPIRVSRNSNGVLRISNTE